MAPSHLLLLPLLALTAPLVTAKIGFEGCTSTLTTWTYSHDIILYYLPDTGEVCDNPDCGGGRAPPKTDKPWCGNYKGTTTYSPMFIKLPTPTTTPVPTTSSVSEPEETSDAGSDDETTPSTSEARETGTTFLTSTTAQETGDSSDVTPTKTGTQSENVTPAPSGTDVSSSSAGEEDGTSSTAPTGTDVNPPEDTGAAAGVRVAGGMMAGLVAVAGVLAMC